MKLRQNSGMPRTVRSGPNSKSTHSNGEVTSESRATANGVPTIARPDSISRKHIVVNSPHSDQVLLWRDGKWKIAVAPRANPRKPSTLLQVERSERTVDSISDDNFE